MKKVFLFLTMLLFAFTGTMKAQSLTVHDGTATNGYVPVYGFYADAYNKCEMVYPAAELSEMAGGMINGMTFYATNASVSWGSASFQVFLAEVENATISAFAGPGTVVYEGSLSISGNEMVVTFNTPYMYGGGNLLVGFYQTATGSYVSSTWKGETVTDASGSGYNYSSIASCSFGQKNFLPKTTFDYVPGGVAGLATEPDVLDLGPRPNGAWMAPYKFNLVNNGSPLTINAMDMNGTYFTYDAEVPAIVYAGNPLEVTLTTGDAEPGYISSTLTVLYSENSKDAAQFDVTAYAYDPAEGDVWENAINVTEFPYSDNAPEMIYKNYELPVATEASDAVYKLAFNEDVLLTAGTTAADGVAVLYPEDFAGEGGPTAENYYEYNGPQVNPGPVAMWFNYDYTGSLTNLGYSSAGNLYFGYMIPAEYLQELGLGNCAITTVESALGNYGGTYCDLFILKGGDTPDVNNIVYYQEFTNFTYNYWFDVVLDEPQFLGDDENIWIMFATDNTRMLCATNPVDPAGKVWYTRDATSTSWYNNTTYTPAIYTQFLELPTGREVTVGNNVKMREGVASVASQFTETAANDIMGVSKAQRSINAKAQNNRGEYDIEEMFVPAGTYYLAMASDDVNFPVEISIDEVPVPEQAVVYYPYDGETGVSFPYLAEWSLPDYTTEMQVLLGTQYPPQTALIDWTDYLVESAFLPELQNNQSYFMQVNVRNGAGTTYGEVIAFTTPIDGVEGFEVETTELYPGDAAVFSWEANARTLKGYNLYMSDGVEVTKVNEGLITETTYSVEGLEYNMNGYQFAVTAVYDAGESDFSDVITVYMTGNGSVSGHVYDIDVEHPIAGANIIALGVDEHGNAQTFNFTTDETGLYEGDLLAGIYAIGIVTEGYQNEGVAITVNYDQLTEVEDIITHEFYYPLGMITATEEESDVLVEWTWRPAEESVDFETGDFSQADFVLPATYPWAITTVNPHEGTYCMKSTCEGVASGTSSIELNVDVPYDGKMGFWVRVSSEASYDKFHFYIDGVEKGAAISGQQPYAYKEFDVTEGTHTYKWEYAKDSSVNSNDDCVYVDDITLFRYEEPLPPVVGATEYNFDDDTMMGWTSLDADGDGNGWVSSANPGIYHNSGVSLSGTGHNDSEAYVISGSYANQTGAALTPNNYLVSPTQLSAENGAQIQFWACAQDESYAAEHFGVAVSTTTATAAAFTTIQEWTMTAKNAPAEDKAGKVRGDRQGNWYNYTVDLSAYAGQDIWVAIRHFNCTDMFILNVDDITLATGESKAPQGDRSFQSFNLYRRNNVTNETPELIASGLTDFTYTDEAWATLPYGEYQWGVTATYDGYAPTDRSRETATFGFEGGSLEGWTNLIVNTDGGEWLNSDDNLGGYDYSELAHTGTGFAMCYSYVDYDGAYDTDAFLVSPQKYTMDASSSINFWADNANDDYPEDFSVWVSTAATPTTASDFTEVWSGGAKATVSDGAKVRHSNTRYENWREHTISLASYAGQEIWIAFRDVNYDAYEIWIDDVTITYSGSAPVPPTPPAPTGEGESEILWSNVIEKDMDATITAYVYLSNGQSPVGATVTAVNGDETLTETVGEEGYVTFDVRKGAEYTVTATLSGYTVEEETIFVDEDKTVTFTLVEIIAPVEGLYVSPTGWAKWEGSMPGPQPTPPTPPTPGGDWYFYDDGTFLGSVGLGGGQFQFGVMFPAGTYEGNTVTKVSKYDATGQPMTGTVTIYNDGTTAPATAVGTANCTFTGTVEDFVEVEFATPVTIDPTKNLWVVFDNVSGDAYPAACSTDVSGDPNGRWVAISGTWYDMANVGVSGETIMVRAYVATGAKGEVHEISVPQFQGSNGTLKTMGGNRAPVSYKIKLDGEYLGETTYPFYQFDVEGMEPESEHVAEIAPLYASGMGDWMTYTWTYIPCDEFGGMTELGYEVVEEEGEQDIVISWTLPGGTNPNPNPNPNPGQDEEYDFDDGTMQGWTTIDANNDGYDWVLGSQIGGVYLVAGASLAGSGHNSSADLVCSGSYSNASSSAITPDNYLVAPTKASYSNISFYACGQDASYVSEHFGVAVSTGNSVSDFVMVQEWTMTAKGEGAMSIGRDGQTRAQGSWHEYSVDLSAYAGQDIWIAIRHFNCNDMFILDVDDITLTGAAKGGERDMWDLVTTFNAAEGGQYGVVTDGEYFYTSNWGYSSAAHNFWKYDLDGNQIEGFEISGCGTLRGMTFDGEYVYGVANSSTIYCVDLNNHTLVGTTSSAYGAMRGITYDPERDGFWVIGNWSGNLTLVSRTGAIVQTGPAPTSASDLAYYKDPDGVEHVFCFNNGTNDVDDYNITTGTFTAAVFNFNSTPGFNSGSSGGCHVASYDGKTCFIGDIQQSPNLIGIYELDSTGPTPPTPPTPTGDVLGAVLYRDGEFVGIFDANTSSYTDENVEPGQYEYAIRVIYGGDPDVTYYAMSCPEILNVTVHHLSVAENEVVNSIYPNPTSGDLNINAEAMTHVTVFNAMGQMVYDQNVNADSMVLNMGQFESGVYMVRIDTANGSSVKRITVVK